MRTQPPLKSVVNLAPAHGSNMSACLSGEPEKNNTYPKRSLYKSSNFLLPNSWAASM